MGVTLTEVKKWTWNEFVLWVNGYNDRINEEWEMARTISFFAYMAYPKKLKRPIKKPSDLFRLRADVDIKEISLKGYERYKESERRKLLSNG